MLKEQIQPRCHSKMNTSNYDVTVEVTQTNCDDSGKSIRNGDSKVERTQ